MLLHHATAFSNPTATGDRVARALDLARHGFAVFPLRENKRPFANADVAAALGIPAPPDGQGAAKLATRDEMAIQQLWTAFPGAVIGVATGAASGGLIVLDVDRKNGKDGLVTLATMQLQPPATAWQQTRSGGIHYLYRGPAARHLPTDAGGLGVGLDRRGDGGYFVDYGFDLTAPISQAPEWLLAGSAPRAQDGRRPLGDPALAAPSFDLAVQALNAHDPDNLGRDRWIAVTAEYKQASASLVSEDVARLTWDIWCARYTENNLAENDRQWRSIRSTSSGWVALRDGSPARAKLLFGPGGERSGQLPIPNPRTVPEFISGIEAESVKTTSAAAMRKMHELRIPLAYDEFANIVMLTDIVSWDHESQYPRPWNDNDITGCKTLLESHFLKPSKETVNDVAVFIARLNKFHPIRDYLNSVQWDGVSRLPSLLPRYFGAENDHYTQAIGTRFMIGAVARVMKPGCKNDTMLILEGPQGARKSSALETLCGKQWFTDQLPDITNTKEVGIQLLGKWIIEIAELSAFSRAESNRIKSSVSSSVDRYRAPYGKVSADHPRQCVFAGSTNDEHYLRDQTGNRRYWPAIVGRIDIAALKADRDQLWAEARVRYELGEQWWLTETETHLAENEQEDRRETDPWEGRVQDYVSSLNGDLTTPNAVAVHLNIRLPDLNTVMFKRIAHCLRAAGYARKRYREIPGGPQIWKYGPK